MVARPSEPDEVLSPTELGKKLVIALQSVTDPQALMQAIADRSSLTTKSEFLAKLEAIVTRLDGMEKATELWHDDLVRVPTDVTKSVTALQQLLEQFVRAALAEARGHVERELERGHGATAKLAAVSDERFNAIATQFTLLKQATDQLALASSTAIAAALQAQKEQAGETQRTSKEAIQKSENSTAEQIKSLTTNFNTAMGAMDVRLNEMKGRLDRGEGQSGVVDPQTFRQLADLTTSINSLKQSRDGNDGGAAALAAQSAIASARQANVWAIAAVVVAALTIVVTIVIELVKK